MRLWMPTLGGPVATALAAVVVLAACTAEPARGPVASGGQPAAAAASASAPSTPSTPSTTRDDELIDAAGRGDVAAVRRLVDAGADVRARGRQGRTALIAAAYGNHVDAAQALIEAGADVDAKDPTQQSAYLIATSEVGDDPRLLERTLAAGADVQAKDSYNGTGLIRAGERGFPRIVDRLLRAGVEVDHVNRLGWTALLEAIILGEGGPAHVETVRLLLAGGANPNLPDRDGVTPLAHAQRRGQLPISTLLRDAGARM